MWQKHLRLLYTEDSIGVFILLFFQLLDMCEFISKKFFERKRMKFRAFGEAV